MIIVTTTIFVQGAQSDIQWLSGPVKTVNKQRLRSAGDNDRRSKRFALALCFALVSRASDSWSKHTWSDYKW